MRILRELPVSEHAHTAYHYVDDPVFCDTARYGTIYEVAGGGEAHLGYILALLDTEGNPMRIYSA